MAALYACWMGAAGCGRFAVIIRQEGRRDLIHLNPLRRAVINDPASLGVDG